jgi:hypothetical protein
VVLPIRFSAVKRLRVVALGSGLGLIGREAEWSVACWLCGIARAQPTALENMTDLRYIDTLLSHSSSKTTEFYTHVSTKVIGKIRRPLDDLDL